MAIDIGRLLATPKEEYGVSIVSFLDAAEVIYLAEGGQRQGSLTEWVRKNPQKWQQIGIAAKLRGEPDWPEADQKVQVFSTPRQHGKSFYQKYLHQYK